MLLISEPLGLEVEEVDLVPGERPARDEDALLADPLHHQAGVAVAGARQVWVRLPAARDCIQELDGGQRAVVAVPADDEQRGLVDRHGAEAAI